MNYDLWDKGLNKGLDGNMSMKINRMIKESSLNFTQEKFSIKDLGLACDIKGGFNISQLEDFLPNSRLIEDSTVLEKFKKSLLSEHDKEVK